MHLSIKKPVMWPRYFFFLKPCHLPSVGVTQCPEGWDEIRAIAYSNPVLGVLPPGSPVADQVLHAEIIYWAVDTGIVSDRNTVDMATLEQYFSLAKSCHTLHCYCHHLNICMCIYNIYWRSMWPQFDLLGERSWPSMLLCSWVCNEALWL